MKPGTKQELSTSLPLLGIFKICNSHSFQLLPLNFSSWLRPQFQAVIIINFSETGVRKKEQWRAHTS